MTQKQALYVNTEDLLKYLMDQRDEPGHGFKYICTTLKCILRGATPDTKVPFPVYTAASVRDCFDKDNSTRAERTVDAGIDEFLKTRCKSILGHGTPRPALYSAYLKWCIEHRFESTTHATAFYTAVKQRGYRMVKGPMDRYFKGLVLLTA